MPDDGSPEDASAIGLGTLIASIAVFVVVGMPLVYYLWSVLNELLSGRVEWARLGLAVPVAAVFVVLLVLVVRAISAWEARPTE